MTRAAVIDGKAIAATLRREMAAGVEVFKRERSATPGLAVVLVGEDPASHVYVRTKAKQTREAGMASFEHKLDAATTRGGVARPDRRPEPAPRRARHPRAASVARAHRRRPK